MKCLAQRSLIIVPLFVAGAGEGEGGGALVGVCVASGGRAGVFEDD